MKYIYTQRFQNELLRVSDYIEDEFGKLYAVQFVVNVQKAIQRIVKNPEIAAREPLLADRQTIIRSKIVSKHNKAVFYVKDDTVYFIDLWDIRREPTSLAKRIRKQ